MIRAQARAALLFPLLLVALVGLEFLASGAVGLYHQYRIVSQWPQVSAEVTRS